MKRVLLIVFAMSVAWVASLTGSRGVSQEPTIDSRDSPAEGTLAELNAGQYNNVFTIVDGDAEVGDGRISDVRLTGNTSSFSKLKLAKVMLSNKNERSWKPDFKLRILNKYGVALAHGEVQWALHTLPRNERYEDETSLVKFSHAEVFKYSNVKPVPEFDRPAYIAIEHAP